MEKGRRTDLVDYRSAQSGQANLLEISNLEVADSDASSEAFFLEAFQTRTKSSRGRRL